MNAHSGPVPDWINTIFENDPELEDTTPQEWAERNVEGKTFADFYNEVIESADKQVYIPGKNRSYSLQDFNDETTLNCEGAATAGAIAAELIYDQSLEVLTEWSMGEQERNPLQNHFSEPVFHGHVSLEDPGTGENYGNQAGHPNSQLLDTDALAGIYLVNLADEARANGNQSDADNYLSELQDLKIQSSYVGRRRHEIENKI